MNDRFVWVYVVPLACAALPGLQFVFGYTSDGPLSWPAGLVTAFVPFVGLASALTYELLAQGQWRGVAYLPFGSLAVVNTAFWLWVASEHAGASNIGIGVVFLLAIPVLCLGLPLAALAAARSDGDSRRPTRG